MGSTRKFLLTEDSLKVSIFDTNSGAVLRKAKISLSMLCLRLTVLSLEYSSFCLNSVTVGTRLKRSVTSPKYFLIFCGGIFG